MSKLTYAVTEEIRRVGDEERISYGIAAYENVPENGSAVVIASVGDVSCTRDPMEKLAQWCNLLEISPLHLCDVVEDFLSA